VLAGVPLPRGKSAAKTAAYHTVIDISAAHDVSVIGWRRSAQRRRVTRALAGYQRGIRKGNRLIDNEIARMSAINAASPCRYLRAAASTLCLRNRRGFQDVTGGRRQALPAIT